MIHSLRRAGGSLTSSLTGGPQGINIMRCVKSRRWLSAQWAPGSDPWTTLISQHASYLRRHIYHHDTEILTCASTLCAH